MHVPMGKPLLLIAMVIGIVWLDLLVREQDNRVALLSCCREQLYFFLSERLGRLRKDQISVSADLLQLVSHRLHISHILGVYFAASTCSLAEPPIDLAAMMFNKHEIDLARRHALDHVD